MFKFRLPSPALLVAMLALALVLGGTAVAASTNGDTKPDTKLVKKLAPTLSVKHAVTADSATNASNLGGQPASYYAHAGHEAVHLIGAASEPGFQNGWSNYTNTWSSAGYWKDSMGVVHLTGTIDGGNSSSGQPAFTLPAGYRPALNQFTVAASGATATSLVVLTSGAVAPNAPGQVGLDGVTFLAGTTAATAPRHSATR